MKNIPNILTICRMILSIGFIFTINQRVPFVIIFLLCGATDVLDGYLARRMKLVSISGAKLDSAADLLMYATAIPVFLISIGNELVRFYPFLAVVIFIRLLNLLIARLKYRSFLILHTWGNKIAGLLTYATVCLYMIISWNGIIYIALVIATLTAIEELIIHLSAKEPEPDRRGLFLK